MKHCLCPGYELPEVALNASALVRRPETLQAAALRPKRSMVRTAVFIVCSYTKDKCSGDQLIVTEPRCQHTMACYVDGLVMVLTSANVWGQGIKVIED